MKQSTSSGGHINSSLPTFFGDYEIEVSDILLDLPHLIYESESRYQFQASWGGKRRRSTTNLSPSSSRRVCSSSTPSPSLQKTFQGESETERRPKVEVEAASSPATPLSFSPSESDKKSKHSHKKVYKKRTREDWLENIDGLIQRRELLRGEIETVMSYYKKQKAFNLELKAKKECLQRRFCLSKPQLEITNSGVELSQPLLQDHPQIHYMVHQQPCIVDQTAHGLQTSENFQYPYGQISSGFGLGHMGPLGIPDLNVAAEEAFGMDSPPQPLDQSRALRENRAKAAEARRRRIMKIKEMKNSFAAIKPPRNREPFAFQSR